MSEVYKGWETTYPKNKLAIVNKFTEKFILIAVEKLVLFNGKPERVFGKNSAGSYKFKIDEEPFIVVEAPER